MPSKTSDFGVKERFKHGVMVSKQDLMRFFKEAEPDLKDSTLRWRIYHLKENGILFPVKKGVYSLNQKEIFNPEISTRIKEIQSTYVYNFSPAIRSVIWSTEWLHEFMVQQPTNNLIVIETEKYWMESLFQLLQDTWRNTYLNPNVDVIRNYVLGQKEAIIVKPIVTRSPTLGMEYELELPRLEKILVDVFCDKDLFLSYQGSELENIFRGAWKKYALNLSVLLNYSERRQRSGSIRTFLKNLSIPELQNLTNQ
jgi:hypothetical protein